MPALGLGITAVASVPGILDTFGRKITRARVGTTVHAFMPVAGNPPTAVPMIQWTLNGADLPGATGVYLTVPDLAGTLSWRGTDSDGTSILAETSAEVTGVTAEVTAPPVITLETAPTDDGLAPVTAGESLVSVLGRLTQTGLATTTGTGGVTTVAALLSGDDVVTDLTEGLVIDSVRFMYSATDATDEVRVLPVSITVQAAPVAGAIGFGALTAIGAGGAQTALTDGDYGEFTAAAGILTPRVSPLTPGVVSYNATDITVIADAMTVATVEEWTAANDAAFARTTPTGVMLRDADYLATETLTISLGSRSWIGKPLTTTFADTPRGPRVINSTINLVEGHTIRGVHFHHTRAHVAAFRADNPSKVTQVFRAGGALARDWVLDGCLITGGDVTQAEREDPNPRDDILPLPLAIDLQYAAGAYTIRNTEFRNINEIQIKLMAGALVQDIIIDTVYSDVLRFQSDGGSAPGKMLVDGVLFQNLIGLYNEINGVAPHPDQMQFMQSGTVAPRTVDLTVRRFVGTQGNNRGNKIQFTQSSAEILRSLNLVQCAATVDGVHGLSYGAGSDRVLDVRYIESVLAGHVEGTDPPQIRHNNVVSPGGWIAVRSIVEGDVVEVNQSTNRTYVELRDTVINADFADLVGPRSPGTFADVISSLKSRPGTPLEGLGPWQASGDYKPLPALPDYIPNTSTLSSNAGGELSADLPSAPDMDGGTVAQWDMQYRIQGSQFPWTLVEDVTDGHTITGLADNTYEVQHRVISTEGIPSFWSAPVALMVANVAAGPVYDFDAPGLRAIHGGTGPIIGKTYAQPVRSGRTGAYWTVPVGTLVESQRYRLTVPITATNIVDALALRVATNGSGDSQHVLGAQGAADYELVANTEVSATVEFNAPSVEIFFVLRVPGASTARSVTYGEPLLTAI
jgi:hypothetical protein